MLYRSLGSAAIAIVLVLGSSEATFAHEEMPFLRGDCDLSGHVDVSDAIHTLHWLFNGGTPPENMDASDSNDDGRVDVADVVATLMYLFMGHESLPPPGPVHAGLDPTPDQLPHHHLQEGGDHHHDVEDPDEDGHHHDDDAEDPDEDGHHHDDDAEGGHHHE